MEIKVSTENARVPVTVLHVDGSLDSASYEAFQARAEEQIKSGARHILVDLSHAPFISSAGLRAMHAIFNQLRAVNNDVSEDEMHKGISAGTYKSPHLKLCGLSKEARTAFEMGGFDMYIETFADPKSALASF
jgi:anti-anti-sigma factor